MMSPSTNFSNFTYEIQMKLIKASQAGIVFRADPTKGAFYYFHISSNGSYALETYMNYNSIHIIKRGTSSASKTGLNQTNLLTVSANGNTITLYINKQPIDSVTDDTYTQGQIGVVAENTGSTTEAVFSNVKVWPL